MGIESTDAGRVGKTPAREVEEQPVVFAPAARLRQMLAAFVAAWEANVLFVRFAVGIEVAGDQVLSF